MNKWIRAVVAARRICTVLALDPDLGDAGHPAAAPTSPADLVDLSSGARVRSGLLTALVSDRPEETAEVVDRLGRFADGDVRWGEVPLDEMPQVDVRRRIVVSDTGSALFSGPLADQLDVRGTGMTDADLAWALHAASAEDVVEGLPAGLRSWVAERGRSFSGGQRQRLVLTRALLGAAGGPAARRADLGGRRPHRGPDRRAAGGAPARPHHRGDHHQPAAARPGRRGRVPRRGRRRGHRSATATCWPSVARLPGRGDPRGGGARVSAPPDPTDAAATDHRCPDETLPGQILPVAGRATMRAYLATLARRHRRLLVTMLRLHAAAALAGLVAPRLLGAIVEEVQSGGGVGTVDRLTLVIAAALVAADPADPGRALPVVRLRGAGARRAARGLRRRHPRSADRHGGVSAGPGTC